MEVRHLNEMKKVLYDRKWADKAPNLELYYMYRGVKKKNDLRYDITIMPALMLGQEFNKTMGHGHAGSANELYVVLRGQAVYLLQQYVNGRVKDVYAVKAKKGEAVIIPPFYGHITINPSGKEELKEANWVCRDCRNVYDVFGQKRGACYYYTKRGWIKNKNYARVPKLRFQRPLKKLPRDLSFLGV